VNPGTRLLTTTAGDSAASSAEPPLRRFGTAVLQVLPAWLVARAVVAVTLVVAHLSVSHLRPGNSAALLRVHQGLLGWDAGWYQ
jgi:hypothetical protein